MRELALLLSLSVSLSAGNWPGWRGPNGDGTSPETNLPTQWSASENIHWKERIPGVGHSSPIVWEDAILLTTCLEQEEERRLICLDRRTGKPRWNVKVLNAPLETIHRLNSRASGTPATDGTSIYVAFMRPTGPKIVAPNVGSERMITPGRILLSAYDFSGQIQWQTDLGPFISAHGFNSCPVLYQDLVILNGDHDGNAYVVAVDKRTGEEVWRVDRPGKTRSYGTPLIRTIEGREQMLLAGSRSVASFHPKTGQSHWIIDGPTEQLIATMVYNGTYTFVTGGYPEKHILAIRPTGSGNVTESHIAWRTKRGAAYVPSPILSGPYLLVVADSGIASCFEANTGTRHWMERLPGGHSASPVSADGLVYFVSDKGSTTVIRPGTEFEVIHQNKLGEPVSASPAISQGQIFLRTHEHLYAIGR